MASPVPARTPRGITFNNAARDCCRHFDNHFVHPAQNDKLHVHCHIKFCVKIKMLYFCIRSYFKTKSLMCVNSLINRKMCEKDCQEFGNLGILYKHTHTHTRSPISITTARAVVDKLQATISIVANVFLCLFNKIII